MKGTLLFFAFLFFVISSFSQNRNNNWYFGNFAGINFNTSPPSSLTGSPMYQLEGSASISDNSGNLLFYTDGIKVWNRNNLEMPNGTGLKGDHSSTQSALIIPIPCDTNRYYIFTAPNQGANATDSTGDTLCYSIVDMNLDGGLGDITVKNFPVHKNVREKLTATLKSNGMDYWVVVNETDPEVFLSFSVTANGVDTMPFVSHTGIPMTVNKIGYMKISPDNSKLAAAYFTESACVLLDFNNSTGILSNGKKLIVNICYGVEFSPDNSKLYVGDCFNGIIHQFNQLTGTTTDIQNSDSSFLAGGGMFTLGALQRGPGNKIYVAPIGQYYISVIDQPNQAGSACNFISHYINIGPPGQCEYGLPNNFNAFAPPCNFCPPVSNVANSINICANQTYQLPSGTIVNTAGVYSDTIRNHAGTCDSIRYTINLSMYNVSLLNTTAHICSNQTYQLPSGANVAVEGIYMDTLRNVAGCDSIINVIHVFVNDISNTNIVDSIFAGQPYILPTGETVNAAGIYQNILVNNIGCDSIITITLKLRNEFSECLTLKNAITPNGDGINDYWILYKYYCFKKLEANVYNRYGTLIYHSDDYKNDWNGKYKNKELPDRTYYYILKVISFDDKEHMFKGNVTILR